MTKQTNSQLLVEKCLKLVGLPEGADLSELKRRYAELHKRFNQQLDSDEPEKVKKGQNNLVLLDQTYNVLAKDIRSRQIESHQQATEEAISGATRMSIELCTVRVGFQVLEGSIFALQTKQVNVNLFGMRTVRTNNRISTNWPSGKLVVFNDHLKLKCLLGSYEIYFNDVVAVTKAWYMPFYLFMRQKSDEDIRIHIYGFGLGKRLKELTPQFTSKLTLDY
jgi:hypothetical protein